jgi:2-succinyl-5-enolpyruvyl-6-hydroxy-3-cyclohexene-1-carboxylate synthase
MVGADVAEAPNHAYAFTTAFFEELARAGVRDVCLCPGSRSTPLAVATAQQPALRCWTHIDERSAAFFALGLAKAGRKPVALVCTSGTAAANFLPAVVEAHYAGVPLLLLTADRPPELRDRGAGQTIDQIHLYGRHVRWFAEVALPSAEGEMLRYARALASRAVGVAMRRPAGPVHLNLPFRKPLDPQPTPGDVAADLRERDPLAAAGRGDKAFTEVIEALAVPPPDAVAAIADLVRVHSRGVIACGPIDADSDLAASVSELARRAGWPVLAEPTAQLRRGAHTLDTAIIATSDLFLRDETFAAGHAPDVVLRIGATPTSAAQRRWIERHAPDHLLLIDPEQAWNDPSQLASQVLAVDPERFCRDLSAQLLDRPTNSRSPWLDAFVETDRRASAAIERAIADDESLLEPRAVREIAAASPDDAILYVSNSMPVRDLDAFLPVSTRPLRVLCNRGANGIDGMISSALGAAAADRGRVLLLTGDLAFAHDLGGLLAARRHGLHATIVILNNDGGGIFSYLPIAEYADEVDFEANFRTPLGIDFEPAVATFGARFTRVTSWEHFRAALKESTGASETCVIEVPIDRDLSVAHHRAIERAVSAALAGTPGAPGAPGAPDKRDAR